MLADRASGAAGCTAGAELQPQEWAAAFAGDGSEKLAGGVRLFNGRFVREGARNWCGDGGNKAKIAASHCARRWRATGDSRAGTRRDCASLEWAAGRRLENSRPAS